MTNAGAYGYGAPHRFPRPRPDCRMTSAISPCCPACLREAIAADTTLLEVSKHALCRKRGREGSKQSHPAFRPLLSGSGTCVTGAGSVPKAGVRVAAPTACRSLDASFLLGGVPGFPGFPGFPGLLLGTPSYVRIRPWLLSRHRAQWIVPRPRPDVSPGAGWETAQLDAGLAR